MMNEHSMINSSNALEGVKQFLRTFCYDADSRDEIRLLLKNYARLPNNTLRKDLANFEALLATSQPQGMLSRLVAEDANRSLDDPSDEGAREWLQAIVQFIHEAIEGS